jgi:hypothetical protein
MASENGNGVGWRNVVIAVTTSIILTGAGSWFAFGQDVVHRDELSRLNQNVQALSETISNLKTAVAVLSERVGPGKGAVIR